MAEEAVLQEAKRMGRAAGFILAAALVALVMGLLTGHNAHVLAPSLYFLLLGARLLVFLVIVLHQVRNQAKA